MANDGFAQDGYDSDSEYSDDERLLRLLKKMQELHDESSRVWRYEDELNPQPLNVSEALLALSNLLHLSLSLCPKTSAELWSIDMASDTTQEIIGKLRNASHAAYGSICSKETHLITQKKNIDRLHEVLQDLLGRQEHLEMRCRSVLAVMTVQERNYRERMEQTSTEVENATLGLRKAKWEQEANIARIERKHEVNQNLVSGLVDWFSRKDDQFDLALSLGIGEEAEREKDRQTVRVFDDLLGTQKASYMEASSHLEEARKKLEQLYDAQSQINASSQRIEDFKTRAVGASKGLVERKGSLERIASALSDVENSMQMIDEETRLPTFSQISTEILFVLKASARYQVYESDLKLVNREIWDALVSSNDWQDLFDRDEELESCYKEVKSLLD